MKILLLRPQILLIPIDKVQSLEIVRVGFQKTSRTIVKFLSDQTRITPFEMIWLEKDSQNVYVCIASSLHTQDRRRKDKLLLLHANQQRNTWSSSWFLPQTYPDISL